MGSVGGTTVPADDKLDVIGPGNVIVRSVVVKGAFATIEPEIVRPAPEEIGSEVDALRFVPISLADGVLKI